MVEQRVISCAKETVRPVVGEYAAQKLNNGSVYTKTLYREV